MIEVGGIAYQARETQAGEALPKGALIPSSDGYFDSSGKPISGDGLASSLGSGSVKAQPSSIPSIMTNPYATGPLPLTEAEVRRIVREELARALEMLKKGQST